MVVSNALFPTELTTKICTWVYGLNNSKKENENEEHQPNKDNVYYNDKKISPQKENKYTILKEN